MAFILVRQNVENYKKWKNTFNDAFEMRKEFGEKNNRVFRSSDKPNELFILLEWVSLPSARRFAKSKELHNCMKKAGVVGKPDILFLKEMPLSINSLPFANF